MDFSIYNKKRRLPEVDHPQLVQEDILVDDQSSSRPEFGGISPQDFCSKLRLELSPTVSDINLPSCSRQSSNEDVVSPRGRLEGWPKDDRIGTAGFPCCPETLEISDTGASVTLKMDSSLSGPESPKLPSVQHNLTSNDDGDCHISCLLNLSLSSPLELNRSHNLDAMPLSSQDIGVEPRPNADSHDTSYRSPTKGVHSDDAHIPSSSHDVHNNKQAVVAPPHRVNDVFWEQFLTEKPGCLDTEEGERKSVKGIDHLTL